MCRLLLNIFNWAANSDKSKESTLLKLDAGKSPNIVLGSSYGT